tara:strand:+ start:1914 stop:2189 length:276 start_codon:yes stop_codon:yes gene_type:complete
METIELIEKECENFKKSVISRIKENNTDFSLEDFISNADNTTKAMSENLPILEKRIDKIISESSQNKEYLLKKSNQLKEKVANEITSYFLG